MSQRSSPRRNQLDRNAWLIAWGLTVALHAAGVLGFRHLPSSQQAPTTRRPEPVQLVFQQPAPQARKAETPRFFSELPPDKADKAPVKPDFLSNVTSRARDQVPGGESALPRMNGSADAPMVRLEARGGPSSATAPPSPAPRPNESAAPQAAIPAPPGGAREQDQAATGAWASPPKPAEDHPQAPGDMAAPGSAVNSDTYQPEMDNPDGNAELTGDVSLNTIAWNYAPWLMRFKRQLLHRWIAPPAYYLGLMKEGGWAVIEVEISRSGEELRLELLEAKGHPLLVNAARGAVSSMHPIDPLPADFPEPTLILRIRMVYPKLR